MTRQSGSGAAQGGFALRRSGFIGLLFALLVGLVFPTSAQDSLQTVTGWLTILHGDPQPGQAAQDIYRVRLQNNSGDVLSELIMDDNLAHQYNRQQVQVTGTAGMTASSIGGVPVLEVQSITAVDAGVSAQALTGAQPWANILCKFSNISSTPHQPSWYAGLFGTSYPGLDHYFQTISYGNINLTGTSISSQWFTLPNNQSGYVVGDNANLDALAQDCVNKALAGGQNLTGKVGFNFMLNGDLGCCAWGGSVVLSINGSVNVYRSTWMPPWSQTFDVLAHEMGHGFDFPHSTGPAHNPPRGLNVYVSPYDVMSRSEGAGAYTDLQYGSIPPGTIAYHLDLDGWIPANRKQTVSPGALTTLTLERLLPQSASNLLLATIPISGTNRFYTVEVRDNTPGTYDQAIYPDSTISANQSLAVIIHLVNPNRSFQDGQALLVDGDLNNTLMDSGTRWLAGETYRDATYCISVKVESAAATAMTVSITNFSQNPSSCDIPTLNSYTQPFDLTWNRIANTHHYQLQIANNPQFNTPTINVSDLKYQVTGLTTGNYYWRVRACFTATSTSCGTWGNGTFVILS